MEDEANTKGKPARPHRRCFTHHRAIPKGRPDITCGIRTAAEISSAEHLEWVKQLRKLLAGTSFESFQGASEAAARAALSDLRAIDIPKIDLSTTFRPRIHTSSLVTTRVKPLELDLAKPLRSIVDVRLEALGERLEVVAVALNRLIDVAEVQRDATLASHSAAEVRHARSEALADQRAERAHNLAAWSATFAAVAAIVVVIQFFFG
jgi:hypothetical protein